MALRKTVTISGPSRIFGNGAELDAGEKTVTFDAYIKVERVEATKTFVTARVSFTDDEHSFSRSYGFPLDLDGPNPIKQAYMHMKSTPEFSDAEDV